MCDQPSRSSKNNRHAFPVVMESNAQPKQLTVTKIKLKQQEEFTLCGDSLFSHNGIIVCARVSFLM
jgi:hypothetical protein